MGKSAISMAIFNSYVKLPEDIRNDRNFIETMRFDQHFFLGGLTDLPRVHMAIFNGKTIYKPPFFQIYGDGKSVSEFHGMYHERSSESFHFDLFGDYYSGKLRNFHQQSMGIVQNLDGFVGELWLLIADSNPKWKIMLIV